MTEFIMKLSILTSYVIEFAFWFRCVSWAVCGNSGLMWPTVYIQRLWTGDTFRHIWQRFSPFFLTFLPTCMQKQPWKLNHLWLMHTWMAPAAQVNPVASRHDWVGIATIYLERRQKSAQEKTAKNWHVHQPSSPFFTTHLFDMRLKMMIGRKPILRTRVPEMGRARPWQAREPADSQTVRLWCTDLSPPMNQR